MRITRSDQIDCACPASRAGYRKTWHALSTGNKGDCTKLKGRFAFSDTPDVEWCETQSMVKHQNITSSRCEAMQMQLPNAPRCSFVSRCRRCGGCRTRRCLLPGSSAVCADSPRYCRVTVRNTAPACTNLIEAFPFSFIWSPGTEI